MKIDNDLVKTEIGNIDFTVQASEGDVSNASISIAELGPLLPKGMEVEGSIAVLLSVVSQNDLKNLQFSCIWCENDSKGEACSREALDAWEWENNGQLVVIGTEDGDWLSSRLNLGEITRDNYPVSMESNCIKIDIEQYPAKKVLTLHFVISNNTLPEKEDCSCWYAVDVAHERVIEACR